MKCSFVRTPGLAALMALSLAVAVMLANPTAARAADDYSVVALDNPTDYIITFSVKYGNGSWKAYTLEPNRCLTLSIADTGDAYQIYFPRDIGSGGGCKEYRLTPSTACRPCYDNAQKYKFGKTPCGCYLEVFKK